MRRIGYAFRGSIGKCITDGTVPLITNQYCYVYSIGKNSIAPYTMPAVNCEKASTFLIVHAPTRTVIFRLVDSLAG